MNIRRSTVHRLKVTIAVVVYQRFVHDYKFHQFVSTRLAMETSVDAAPIYRLVYNQNVDLVFCAHMLY